MSSSLDPTPVDPGGHELAPQPEPPALPGRVILRPTREDALEAAASDLHAQASACVGSFGDFHLGVCDSALSLEVCLALLTDPGFRGLPWGRTHLWVVEETAAGPGQDGSAFRSLAGVFLDHAGVPPEQMHPMPTGSPGAAEQYQSELREHLGWREKGHDRLDFVLLALSAVVPAAEAGLLVTAAGPGGGLSLTAEMLNASRALAVLAAGPEHHGALAPGRGLPEGAARLRPLAGELRWYLDHGAIGLGKDGAR